MRPEEIERAVTIYAIFACFHFLSACHRLQPGFQNAAGDPVMPAVIYRTAAQCVSAMHAISGYRYSATPADTRHLRIEVGPSEWYVCMRRHIDTWSPN